MGSIARVGRPACGALDFIRRRLVGDGREKLPYFSWYKVSALKVRIISSRYINLQ